VATEGVRTLLLPADPVELVASSAPEDPVEALGAASDGTCPPPQAAAARIKGAIAVNRFQ